MVVVDTFVITQALANVKLESLNVPIDVLKLLEAPVVDTTYILSLLRS